MENGIGSDQGAPEAPEPKDVQEPKQEEKPVDESPAVELEGSQDARNMALLCHLLGLFTFFIGPLIVWLLKKDDSPYVDRQGKEALNFQIGITIAYFVSSWLTLICIGVVLLAVVFVVDLIFVIMACMAASKGEEYRYPVSLRLIK